MKNAHELLAALSASIPEASNVRLELFEQVLTIQFNVGDQGSRYGLENADYDRPVGDIVAEIVAHHRSGARAPVDDVRKPRP